LESYREIKKDYFEVAKMKAEIEQNKEQEFAAKTVHLGYPTEKKNVFLRD